MNEPTEREAVVSRAAATRVRRARPADRRRPAVCLFSFHPLLASEFERLLSGGDFRLIERRLRTDGMPDLAELNVPQASVYVLEAHANREVTNAVAAEVLSRKPRGRLVVVSEKLPEAIAFPLLRIGVKGFVRYVEVAGLLSRVLREVAGGGFWVPRSLLSRFVDSTVGRSRPARPLPGTTRLSRREREVFDLLLENLSNKQIAAKLQLSERTAKFHVSNLLAKYGVKRRADLIVLCLSQSALA
jgi:DNA-binding NarL/FixJ family response regulator